MYIQKSIKKDIRVRLKMNLSAAIQLCSIAKELFE
jgi:hypothetical protein